MKLVLAVATLALVAGCSGSASSSGGSTDPSVDWSQYAPGVKGRIDRRAAKGNCGALQREFDNTQSVDLMSYIDAKMKGADCY